MPQKSRQRRLTKPRKERRRRQIPSESRSTPHVLPGSPTQDFDAESQLLEPAPQLQTIKAALEIQMRNPRLAQLDISCWCIKDDGVDQILHLFEALRPRRVKVRIITNFFDGKSHVDAIRRVKQSSDHVRIKLMDSEESALCFPPWGWMFHDGAGSCYESVLGFNSGIEECGLLTTTGDKEDGAARHVMEFNRFWDQQDESLETKLHEYTEATHARWVLMEEDDRAIFGNGVERPVTFFLS
ncbi:uncharacterized protein PV07_08789 [Cladophialophora immunda]|uniref:Phospholipase D-like domain-containing protein n=1 Tax=Cladophialophora immunda TaxID=569365 RepID=A0A0D2C341_9EURO|nr:uncharacterized protein PV07_08789 [Cladophialophora immunda]KIW25623.1 hypothetical protein PV07_08789 [Cladophialophora immunda]OQV11012.1 hypothetical protein CLAIMM_14919 [Cladophialophora immunda]